jgi:septin family protein
MKKESASLGSIHDEEHRVNYDNTDFKFMRAFLIQTALKDLKKKIS